ncbi:MAG: methyltransferase domain-containing protein [Deltaproteobacteria bacterium]|nr:methyltransferase domain-containing protein [Deltaproteobacteria bacterium]
MSDPPHRVTDRASDYIHGATDAREIARLEKQARFVAPWSLAAFDALEGMRVLDLGTGIGAMAGEIAARFPGIELVGLDRSPAQLAVARARHPVATYVEGDAAALPFADASFDRVHASWLLEHVSDPMAVAREIARVLCPGGVAHIVEVDNATLRTEPPLSIVRELMDALGAAQRAAGGDPSIGRKLRPLLEHAGFVSVEVRSLPLVGDAGDGAFFRAFVEEFAEIFESIDETLAPAMLPRIDEAAARLRALPSITGAAIHYAPVLARAVR